jgi:HAMP domain-containing protein
VLTAPSLLLLRDYLVGLSAPAPDTAALLTQLPSAASPFASPQYFFSPFVFGPISVKNDSHPAAPGPRRQLFAAALLLSVLGAADTHQPQTALNSLADAFIKPCFGTACPDPAQTFLHALHAILALCDVGARLRQSGHRDLGLVREQLIDAVLSSFPGFAAALAAFPAVSEPDLFCLTFFVAELTISSLLPHMEHNQIAALAANLAPLCSSAENALLRAPQSASALKSLLVPASVPPSGAPADSQALFQTLQAAGARNAACPSAATASLLSCLEGFLRLLCALFRMDALAFTDLNHSSSTIPSSQFAEQPANAPSLADVAFSSLAAMLPAVIRVPDPLVQATLGRTLCALAEFHAEHLMKVPEDITHTVVIALMNVISSHEAALSARALRASASLFFAFGDSFQRAWVAQDSSMASDLAAAIAAERVRRRMPANEVPASAGAVGYTLSPRIASSLFGLAKTIKASASAPSSHETVRAAAIEALFLLGRAAPVALALLLTGSGPNRAAQAPLVAQALGGVRFSVRGARGVSAFSKTVGVLLAREG